MTQSKPAIPELKFNQIHELIKAQIECNIVPFLLGEPGIGKSASIKAIASELNTKVFVLSVNQLGTREDLTGTRTVPTKDKTVPYKQVFFPHAIVQDAITYAKNHPNETPLLFLDEINRTSPDVTSAILALITERRLGTVRLPENIRIIAAGNDKGNVNSLDLASITRMAIYHVIPDVESFITSQPQLNYYVKKFIQKNPQALVESTMTTEIDYDEDNDSEDSLSNLDAMFDDEGIRQMTVPRTLTYTSDLLNHLNFDGKTMPQNVDTLIDPLDPEDSALYFGIQSQLGQTHAADDLFNMIVDDYNKLSVASTSNRQAMSYQLPKTITIDDLSNLVSDEDTDNYFNKHITRLSESNQLQTLGYLSLTENIKKINNPQAIERIFTNALNTPSTAKSLTKLPKNVLKTGIASNILNIIYNATPVDDNVKTLQQTLHLLLD